MKGFARTSIALALACLTFSIAAGCGPGFKTGAGPDGGGPNPGPPARSFLFAVQSAANRLTVHEISSDSTFTKVAEVTVAPTPRAVVYDAAHQAVIVVRSDASDVRAEIFNWDPLAHSLTAHPSGPQILTSTQSVFGAYLHPSTSRLFVMFDAASAVQSIFGASGLSAAGYAQISSLGSSRTILSATIDANGQYFYFAMSSSPPGSRTYRASISPWNAGAPSVEIGNDALTELAVSPRADFLFGLQGGAIKRLAGFGASMTPQPGPTPVANPQRLIFDASGEFLVAADSQAVGAARITQPTDGSTWTTINSVSPGETMNPTVMVHDPLRGLIVIGDCTNNRIEFFSLDAASGWMLPRGGSAYTDGSFACPSALAVGRYDP